VYYWRLIFIQDNARGYASKEALEYIRQVGLIPIFWPANSPDLNPIETVWDWIKDYIQERYPQIYRSYKRLREAVIEAWNSITDKQVKDLVKGMHDRCQAVIDADGGHTKY